VKVNLLGNEIIGTNDPAVAELFVKESEYFKSNRLVAKVCSQVTATIWTGNWLINF
jgi:hypothetical protein